MSSERQRAIRKLDKVFNEYIRKRDCKDGFGVCCSSGKRIAYEDGDAGHFIGRRFMATRWNETNVHFQSRYDNRFNEGNSVGYTLFMIDKYGREHVEYLQALSKETPKYTLSEVKLMIEEYQKKLKE